VAGIDGRTGIIEVPRRRGQLARMDIGRCLSGRHVSATVCVIRHEHALYNGPETLLTCDEVARILHVSRRTVAKLAAEGELPRVKIGRAARFRPRDLAALIGRGAQGDEDPSTSIGHAGGVADAKTDGGIVGHVPL